MKRLGDTFYIVTDELAKMYEELLSGLGNEAGSLYDAAARDKEKKRAIAAVVHDYIVLRADHPKLLVNDVREILSSNTKEDYERITRLEDVDPYFDFLTPDFAGAFRTTGLFLVAQVRAALLYSAPQPLIKRIFKALDQQIGSWYERPEGYDLEAVAANVYEDMKDKASIMGIDTGLWIEQPSSVSIGKRLRLENITANNDKISQSLPKMESNQPYALRTGGRLGVSAQLNVMETPEVGLAPKIDAIEATNFEAIQENINCPIVMNGSRQETFDIACSYLEAGQRYFTPADIAAAKTGYKVRPSKKLIGDVKSDIEIMSNCKILIDATDSVENAGALKESGLIPEGRGMKKLPELASFKVCDFLLPVRRIDGVTRQGRTLETCYEFICADVPGLRQYARAKGQLLSRPVSALDTWNGAAGVKSTPQTMDLNRHILNEIARMKNGKARKLPNGEPNNHILYETLYKVAGLAPREEATNPKERNKLGVMESRVREKVRVILDGLKAEGKLREWAILYEKRTPRGIEISF